MGAKCTVIRDNSAVACILDKKVLSALEQIWIGRLAPFELIFKYRAGKYNTVADALSRMKGDEVDGDDINHLYENDLEVNEITVVKEMEGEELRRLQREDKEIEKVLGVIEGTGVSGRYKLVDGILFKERKGEGKVLVVSQVLIKDILKGVHVDNGHQGTDRTVYRVNLFYTWVGLYMDIKDYVRNCRICQISKNNGRMPIIEQGSLSATRPLELVFMDFVRLDKASDGRESVLVITDAYTKYTKAIPTRNKLAITVANILMNEWIFNFGTPQRIHTDQGRNFQSEIVEELCKLFGIVQSSTSPYHPQGNGQCERMNRSIINMLRTLGEEEKSKWPIYLPKFVHAYNSTPHATTGYTPFVLMFGREERLPIDNRLCLNRCKGTGDINWIVEMNKKVCEINERVLEKMRRRNNVKVEGEKELETDCLVRIKSRI